MITDDDLVERLRKGDRYALAALFERHRDFVYRVALGLTGDREDAAEIVQETFMALLERSSSLDPSRGRVTTWLFGVARRRAVDRFRRNRSGAARPDPVAPEGDSPLDSAIASERREALQRAVARLPERSREVFVLRIGLGLSVDETALILGCQNGAVRTALYDAHHRLREILAASEEGGTNVGHPAPSAE